MVSAGSVAGASVGAAVVVGASVVGASVGAAVGAFEPEHPDSKDSIMAAISSRGEIFFIMSVLSPLLHLSERRVDPVPLVKQYISLPRFHEPFPLYLPLQPNMS